jgi:hypothetical protein
MTDLLGRKVPASIMQNSQDHQALWRHAVPSGAQLSTEFIDHRETSLLRLLAIRNYNKRKNCTEGLNEKCFEFTEKVNSKH